MPQADPRWVRLREYGGRLEADLDIALLEEAGIPFVVKGPATGIFGPGFAGSTPLGLTILVPDELLGAAREVLGIAGGAGGE